MLRNLDTLKFMATLNTNPPFTGHYSMNGLARVADGVFLIERSGVSSDRSEYLLNSFVASTDHAMRGAIESVDFLPSVEKFDADESSYVVFIRNGKPALSAWEQRDAKRGIAFTRKWGSGLYDPSGFEYAVVKFDTDAELFV